MKCLRVGVAQADFVVGDIRGNLETIRAWIARARRRGVQLLVFPELAVTGYPPKDLLRKPEFVRRNVEAAASLARATRGLCVVVGFVELADDLYNAAAVFHDGRWIGTQRKRVLPNYDVFDEERYFQAGDRSLLFELDRVRLGVNICEDIWFPGGPTVELATSGAEVVVNISASPFHAGKAAARTRMMGTRARDNLVFLVFANLVGGQDELVFDGRSMVIDPEGRCLARGKAFAEDLVVADLNLEQVQHQRLANPRNRRKVREARRAGRILEAVVSPGRTRATAARDCRKGDAPEPPWKEASPPPAAEPVEEIYEALRLGVADYARKNGFGSAVVGLSGGIDSALTATLAADALGPRKVLGVAMPSAVSSPESLEDARRLARNLGIRLEEIPIEPIFRAYREALARIFGRRRPDVTEQNLQARIRGALLMALSNKFGHLVLSTGNKSEVGVGYATLYGDMAGGLAVLADVPKTLVYALARFRNARGESPVIPRRILQKPPSAELAPGQKDSDDLPDYAVLDGILHAYVERDESAAEIAARGYDPAVVARVVAMVDRNEYKRQQAPPGIRITPRAFGSGRRLPITNRYRDAAPRHGRGEDGA